MPYQANPFLERMSERTTSDQTFVRLFSPKILDRLNDDAFEGAVHVFRSPPGGGKTTLLRAFTPMALHAFWNSLRVNDITEAARKLVARDILDEREGPKLLGVLLSCASGYADLPPGADNAQEGLFRALLDCRVVLRTLRSLALLIGREATGRFERVVLEYDAAANDLTSIPRMNSPTELIAWAEERERAVYSQLDSIAGSHEEAMPAHVRYEGLLWLQSVRFMADGRDLAPKRLLMIDDLHRLRRRQRRLLISEFVELRPSIPVWLAERTIALGEQLLAQGAREGRELREYSLDEIWSAASGRHQFITFAQNILDRRLDVQQVLPHGPTFSQYLQAQLQQTDVRAEVEKGIARFEAELEKHAEKHRYTEWVAHARDLVSQGTLDALRELYVTRILLLRDQGKRQMTLDLEPLAAGELEERDSSQVQAAADIFMNDELGIPYFFGMERVCAMATFNVEELLSIAAALYEALLAKQMLRKPDLLLAPCEQEKLIRDVAGKKLSFIPRNHTEGVRARRLLEAIGAFCRERTFVGNAPIAPGVTGVRLSACQQTTLYTDKPPLRERASTLRCVLSECVAENLLIVRESKASTNRESGSIFYLNRMLCAHFGLPLQLGGWQDVDASEMADWMERGPRRIKRNVMELE